MLKPLLSFQQFTGLRNLDLSHNDLGDTGGQILGHAIGKVKNTKRNSSRREINWKLRVANPRDL